MTVKDVKSGGYGNGQHRWSRRWDVIIVPACRLVIVTVIICAFIWRQDIDASVDEVYQVLRSSWLFQHESFEPLLSAASFLFFIGLWGIVDFFIPWASTHRSTPSDDLTAWLKGDRFRQQALWYLLPLVTLDLLFPRRRLPESAPSLARIVVEVVAAIAVYDVAFFAWHASAHRSPYLFRKVHALHHHCYIQRAPEAIRHTFIDGSVDVLCSVFALNVIGCHPLSRAVYDVVIIGLITELHAGYDFPWQLHRVVPFGLYGGAPRHERHHREGVVYMQKFGTYLDEAFGFVPGGKKDPFMS